MVDRKSIRPEIAGDIARTDSLINCFVFLNT